MDDSPLFDMGDLAPTASTSRSQPGTQFAIDPALGGDGSWDGSQRSGAGGDGGDDSFDEDSEDDDDDARQQQDSEDDEEEEEDSDTDAEEEFRTQMESQQTQSTKRRKNAPGRGAGLLDARGGADKGKGRAVDQDAGDDAEEGGDLNRLISAIRDSGTEVGGRTALDREFDRTIEEELDGIDEPLVAGQSNKDKGKGKAPKKLRGPRNEAEPSAEVKQLMGAANRAYAVGELDEALEHLTEVVRIDPAIRMPWYTLATIHEEKGNRDKAVMFKIVATHLLPLKKAGPEWAGLGAQSRDAGLLQQAIYCYNQAIKADKNDVDSMWDRAVLLKLSGSAKQASKAFSALLNIHPHDPGVLRELAPLLAQTGQHARATSLYIAAYDYFRQTVPHITLGNVDLISDFGAQDLELLADFLVQQLAWPKVVNLIRQGVRWLQSREKEAGWDALDDDREYDLERKTRDGWERDARYLEESSVNELDVRLRLRLGMARMGEGKVEEAERHFAIVKLESAIEYPEMFGAMADSYYGRKMYDEAIEIWQGLCENEDTNSSNLWIKIGAARFDQNDYEAALECYEAAVEAEPDNLHLKISLAKTLEALDRKEEAMEIVTAVRAIRRATTGYNYVRKTDPSQRKIRTPAHPGAAAANREARAAAKAERKALEEERQREFQAVYQRLGDIEARVDAGDEVARAEWLEGATVLVDAFRETKQLFPSDPNKRFTGTRKWKRKNHKEKNVEQEADELGDRLERSLNEPDEEPVAVDSFREIAFDQWLTLIIKYAFVLTSNEEAEAAQETLSHVQEASVFKQSSQRSMSLKLALAACYSYVGNHTEVVNIARSIQRSHQFQTESLRILLALLPQGTGAIEAFNSGPLQKFLHRQLRAVDWMASGKGVREGAKGIVLLKEGEQADDYDDGDGADDGEGDEEKFRPKKHSPYYNLIYGHLMTTSKSYQPAIVYLLRAYELAPKVPLINLSLAVAYLHRAMSRQTDNRHHQIAQALTFLSQYRDIKGSCQEVEYNFGRAFHHLGVQAYAVKHYEACLALATIERQAKMAVDDGGEGQDVDFGPHDFAPLAAYNLSNLYVVSGSPELARVVARKWLVF